MSAVLLGPLITVTLAGRSPERAAVQVRMSLVRRSAATRAMCTGGSSDAMRLRPGPLRTTTEPVSASAASAPVTPASASAQNARRSPSVRPTTCQAMPGQRAARSTPASGGSSLATTRAAPRSRSTSPNRSSASSAVAARITSPCSPLSVAVKRAARSSNCWRERQGAGGGVLPRSLLRRAVRISSRAVLITVSLLCGAAGATARPGARGSPRSARRSARATVCARLS